MIYLVNTIVFTAKVKKIQAGYYELRKFFTDRDHYRSIVLP